jgi:Tol biopolymer transport system component
MEDSTADRRQLLTTGDLDGRIFSLSPDGEWLLFTRASEQEGTINHLWAAPVDRDAGEPVDLGVANVVHFAEWQPETERTVAYSTVEPRPGAPGWQANNDLGMLTFSSTGFVRQLPAVVETNSGGLYGWWGTDFSWSPDGLRLAYARPDEVGTVSLEDGSQVPLQQFTPVQTFGDWAWVPGIAWSPDGLYLYSVNHQAPVESQRFDLEVIQTLEDGSLIVAGDTGMFAYPVVSPQEESLAGESTYQIAYLQAIFTSQSESSRYRLTVMDRDGSNRKSIFPVEGTGGLDPQEVIWSPEVLPGTDHLAVGVVYENNLWLVDSETGEAWQITGDGLTNRADWN